MKPASKRAQPPPSRPRLPGVTLLAVTSVDIEATHAALLHCASQIDFGAVKMLCSAPPRQADPRVRYVPIPRLDLLGYSRFMIEQLNAHVDTRHCLVIQADGFVLDPARWNPRFLDYDYVGAPWPPYVEISGPGQQRLNLDKNSVGNGGFSLRSKKLLEVTSRLCFDHLDFPLKSEDLLICHYLHDEMRAAGIQFAPAPLAAQFSIEALSSPHGQSLGSVFGFHGKHWVDKAVKRIKTRRSRNA